MDFPERKHNRLHNYDYSKNGLYFVTICTKDKQQILSKIVDRAGVQVELTQIGKIVDNGINNISKQYDYIDVVKYVIMPNHIHLIIRFDKAFQLPNDDGRLIIAPTVGTVVKGLKGYVTKQFGASIWQKGFYDHIIRNEEDYQNIYNYVKNNPRNWLYNDNFNDY